MVFVVCFIVFISIILNVAHHSLSREYTTMRCKDTNFLSYKHQNARKFIHIYDSLTPHNQQKHVGQTGDIEQNHHQCQQDVANGHKGHYDTGKMGYTANASKDYD